MGKIPDSIDYFKDAEEICDSLSSWNSYETVALYLEQNSITTIYTISQAV